jgi:hypothetical protein
MATGCLSTAQTPDLPAAACYRGDVYHTGTWPGLVRFEDQSVGIVGTGSSGKAPGPHQQWRVRRGNRQSSACWVTLVTKSSGSGTATRSRYSVMVLGH